MAELDNRIHIVDRDVKRRAQIAYRLNANDFLAHVYQDLTELIEYPVKSGLVLLSDTAISTAFADAASSLGAKDGDLPIALFGETPATQRIVEAMLGGAVDYLEWPFDSCRVKETFARFDADTSRAQIARRQRDAINRVARLTLRERDILSHLIAGFGNMGMGRELGISPRTVEVHRANMMTKLNARSTAEAVRIGIYSGLDD